MDKIKQEIRDYWHKRSDDYEKWHLTRTEEEKLAYKKVLGRVLGNDKLNILDVGTGTGYIALVLAEMGHKVTGVDIAEGLLEKAKKLARDSGLSIKFEIGDAENLPFENESFDAVVCRWLFRTLPNHLKALQEWVRVTKPGGRILVIDSKWRDLSSLNGILREMWRWLAIIIYKRALPWKYGYRKEINKSLPARYGVIPEKVVNIFKQAGLDNISVEMLNEIRVIQCKTAPLLYKPVYSLPIFLIKGECHNK